jgi:hypothetical protein
MKTPIELLRQELSLLRFTASGRINTAKRQEAKRLIPLYLAAIELLSVITKD